MLCTKRFARTTTLPLRAAFQDIERIDNSGAAPDPTPVARR